MSEDEVFGFACNRCTYSPFRCGVQVFGGVTRRRLQKGRFVNENINPVNRTDA